MSPLAGNAEAIHTDVMDERGDTATENGKTDRIPALSAPAPVTELRPRRFCVLHSKPA